MKKWKVTFCKLRSPSSRKEFRNYMRTFSNFPGTSIKRFSTRVVCGVHSADLAQQPWEIYKAHCRIRRHECVDRIQYRMKREWPLRHDLSPPKTLNTWASLGAVQEEQSLLRQYNIRFQFSWTNHRVFETPSTRSRYGRAHDRHVSSVRRYGKAKTAWSPRNRPIIRWTRAIRWDCSRQITKMWREIGLKRALARTWHVSQSVVQCGTHSAKMPVRRTNFHAFTSALVSILFLVLVALRVGQVSLAMSSHEVLRTTHFATISFILSINEVLHEILVAVFIEIIFICKILLCYDTLLIDSRRNLSIDADVWR